MGHLLRAKIQFWRINCFIWTSDYYPLLFIYVGTNDGAKETQTISRRTKELWSEGERHGQPGWWSYFCQWKGKAQTGVVASSGWTPGCMAGVTNWFLKAWVLPWGTWTAEQMTGLARVSLPIGSLTLWGGL